MRRLVGRARSRQVPERVHHRVHTFHPPYIRCLCRWGRSAPQDLLIERQRDWMLDQFTRHLAAERLARRQAIAARRSLAPAPPAAPEGAP